MNDLSFFHHADSEARIAELEHDRATLRVVLVLDQGEPISIMVLPVDRAIAVAEELRLALEQDCDNLISIEVYEPDTLVDVKTILNL